MSRHKTTIWANNIYPCVRPQRWRLFFYPCHVCCRLKTQDIKAFANQKWTMCGFVWAQHVVHDQLGCQVHLVYRHPSSLLPLSCARETLASCNFGSLLTSLLFSLHVSFLFFPTIRVFGWTSARRNQPYPSTRCLGLGHPYHGDTDGECVARPYSSFTCDACSPFVGHAVTAQGKSLHGRVEAQGPRQQRHPLVPYRVSGRISRAPDGGLLMTENRKFSIPVYRSYDAPGRTPGRVHCFSASNRLAEL